MQASVKLEHGMTFTGSADSGFSLTLGTDPAVGGDNDGMRPMELMLVSLAGCTAMDVISILRKKRQDVTGFEVRVEADRADKHPKVFTALRLHYVVTGNGVQAAAVERAMQLSADTYCPAQAMLGQVAPLSMSYEVIDAAPSA